MATEKNLAIACIAVACIALGIGSAALRAEPCGLVVTQDTVLTGDVSSCAGDGIVIAADGFNDVTSDFNRKVGIFVWNSSEVDLAANTVTINSEAGIETLDSDVRLFGNRASSNSLYGIVVTGSGPMGKLRLVDNSSRDAGSRAGFLISGGNPTRKNTNGPCFPETACPLFLP